MKSKKLEGQRFREIVEEFKARLNAGESYKKIQQEFQPYLDEMNEAMKKVAKENKRKFYEITFAKLMR